jgi:hypothetical protein
MQTRRVHLYQNPRLLKDIKRSELAWDHLLWAVQPAGHVQSNFAVVVAVKPARPVRLGVQGRMDFSRAWPLAALCACLWLLSWLLVGWIAAG